jgi:hypothetical protein
MTTLPSGSQSVISPAPTPTHEPDQAPLLQLKLLPRHKQLPSGTETGLALMITMMMMMMMTMTMMTTTILALHAMQRPLLLPHLVPFHEEETAHPSQPLLLPRMHQLVHVVLMAGAAPF